MEQETRQRWLEKFLAAYPHQDPGSIPEILPKYMTVEEFTGQGDDGSWYSFGDDPDEVLDGCIRDYEDSFYAPFLLVDLDSGVEHEVEEFALVEPLPEPAREPHRPYVRPVLSELAEGSPRPSSSAPSRPEQDL